jgi:hypothetical protein
MQFTMENWVSMAAGVLSIVVALVLSRRLFGANSGAGGVGALEFVYYLTALAGLLIGWYFNFQFMAGPSSGWVDWMRDIFANPAAASASQDLVIANLIILPLWTFVDGRRSKLPGYWWYFPMSIVTSYAFAAALYLAMRERQHRINTKAA